MEDKIDSEKVYLKKGMFSGDISSVDDIYIGYKGVGEAKIPQTLIYDLMDKNSVFGKSILNSPKQLLILATDVAIKESQYIPFEEIKTVTP